MGIGQFYLLMNLLCGLLGLLLGLAITSLAVLASAGHPSAADDRNTLADLLRENGVADDAARQILLGGLNPWALWRWKTRPVLWRWGRDWPEYYPLSEADLEQHFFAKVPEPPPSYKPLTAPEEASGAPSTLGAPDDLDASVLQSLQDAPPPSPAPEPESAPPN